MLHAPSRTIKLAGVAALAGLMLTVAVIAATDDPAPASPPSFAVRGAERRDQLSGELERCTALTMPDSSCEAAWAEHRRRFLRQDDVVLEPAHSGASPAAEDAAP